MTQQLNIPSIFKVDSYKFSHHKMYPEGTKYLYSTMTVRSFEHLNKSLGFETDEYVVFGVYQAIEEIIEDWEKIFNMSKPEFFAELEKYKTYLRKFSLQSPDAEVDVQHIIDLYNNEVLPLKFKNIKDGTVVKGNKIPFLTIENTNPKFAWLVNYIEDELSSKIWPSIVSATIAYHYRKICEHFYNETGSEAMRWFVDWQCHDFSYRGLKNIEDVCKTGTAHLASFNGTDNVPAVYYIQNELDDSFDSFGSVFASEHSTASLSIVNFEQIYGNKRDAELQYLKYLLTEVFPTGVLSYVSDTYDFYGLVTDILPDLKDVIVNRPGKLVIRPDSFDDIVLGLCGDPNATTIHEQKGLIETLMDIFGYTVNDKGYKELPACIGAIYGDSCTPWRVKKIFQLLKSKGIASTNIVFGIGLT